MPTAKRPAAFSSSSSPTPAQGTQAASLFESQESSFAQTAATAGSSAAADLAMPFSIPTTMHGASVSQGPASSRALTAATAALSVEGSASQAAESSARAVGEHVRRDRSSVGERPSLLCKPDVSAYSSFWRFDNESSPYSKRPSTVTRGLTRILWLEHLADLCCGATVRGRNRRQVKPAFFATVRFQ